MPKNIFTLLLSCFTSLLFGQSYRPLPNNATWTYEQFDDYWNPTGVWTDVVLWGDTIIDNHAYKKMTQDRYYYLGAVRDSAKRIYYRPYNSTTEYLAADFNLTAGDTLIRCYLLNGNQTLCDTTIILREDSFLMEDGHHRSLIRAGCEQGAWIEGFETGFHLDYQCVLSTSGGYVLVCFYDSTELRYSAPGKSCYRYMGIEETSILTRANVVPNPASGLITVSLPNSAQEHIITITNLVGAILYQEKTPCCKKEIDVSNLPGGMYFVNNTKFIKE